MVFHLKGEKRVSLMGVKMCLKHRWSRLVEFTALSKQTQEQTHFNVTALPQGPKKKSQVRKYSIFLFFTMLKKILLPKSCTWKEP